METTIAAVHRLFTTTEDSKPSNTFYLAFLTLLLLCILPSLLFGLGVTFESQSLSVHDWLDGDHSIDGLFHVLNGAHHHALLEWTAVTIGLLTVILTFVHYNLSHDFTTPVIGMALFCSAVMDLFHTVAALRIVEATADNTDFIPFTWALSRTFHAAILVIGVIISLYFRRLNNRSNSHHVYTLSAAFAVVSYLLIQWAATSDSLPQTQYPDALVTRPFDLLPMVVFVLAIPLFRALYNRFPSRLTASLLLALIPEIALEAHMAFGSSRLFDHHFNIAHSLKIFAYLVPFLGLAAEYARAYQEESRAKNHLDSRNQELDEAVGALTDSNEELERFAFICSHDLQEPVRTVHGFSELLERHLGDNLDEKGRKYLNFIREGSDRARSMITDILVLSRLDQEALAIERVDLEDVCRQVDDAILSSRKKKNGEFTWDASLPVIPGISSQVSQVLLNLVSNGFKFNENALPKVHITAEERASHWLISVVDNGIGISSEYHDKVFEIFQRLNKRSDFPGTGIGLAICRKIVERHHGTIELQSKQGEGCVFRIFWPKQITEESRVMKNDL